MHSTLILVQLIITLVMITTSVAIAVKWIRLPYSIALVLVGLSIGVFHLLPRVSLTPELILIVFLPALLFEAAWNLDLGMLKENWLVIGAMAVPGVVVSTLIIGAIMHIFGGFGLTVALLLGAMLSATDPISVLALFKNIGIEKRLSTLLECESIFNDGTSVVLFRILVLASVSSTVNSIPLMIGSFVTMAIGGVIVGLLVGLGASRLTRLFEDHLLELTLTVLAAYGSYLLAEQLNVSAVLAVVVAGMIMGNYGRKSGMSSITTLTVVSFWEYAAFLVESMVFLLIGMQIHLDLLIEYVGPILLAIAAMLVARALIVYGITSLLSKQKPPIPMNWRHLIFWGGVRGSLCIAMTLSVPSTLQEREAFIVITFGVVLFTLLVQGLTIGPLSDVLTGVKRVSKLSLYKSLMTKLAEKHQELARTESDFDNRKIQRKDLKAKRIELSRLTEKIEQDIDILRLKDSSIREFESRYLDKALLEAQKDTLIKLDREHVLSKGFVSESQQRVDDELAALHELTCSEVAKQLEAEKPPFEQID